MPDLKVALTVPQTQRMARAFSFLNEGTDAGKPATTAQVQDWIREQLKGKVRHYEHRQRGNAADAQADAALQAEGW